MNPIFIVLTRINGKLIRINISTITSYESPGDSTLVKHAGGLTIEVIQSPEAIDTAIHNAVVDDRRL